MINEISLTLPPDNIVGLPRLGDDINDSAWLKVVRRVRRKHLSWRTEGTTSPGARSRPFSTSFLSLDLLSAGWCLGREDAGKQRQADTLEARVINLGGRVTFENSPWARFVPTVSFRVFGRRASEENVRGGKVGRGRLGKGLWKVKSSTLEHRVTMLDLFTDRDPQGMNATTFDPSKYPRNRPIVRLQDLDNIVLPRELESRTEGVPVARNFNANRKC